MDNTANMSTTVPGAEGATVPIWRLHLLRAMYLVFVVGGFLVHPQWMLDPSSTARGMSQGMLAGLWLLSFFGLRYPLQMLPLFLYEFVWKLVWLLAFGIPGFLSGRSDPQFQEDLLMIGAGPLVFGLIIPWGFVWHHYFRKSAERWR